MRCNTETVDMLPGVDIVQRIDDDREGLDELDAEARELDLRHRDCGRDGPWEDVDRGAAQGREDIQL